MKTIVALYDDFAAAQRATQELVANGFDRSNISLVVNDVAGEYSRYVNDPDAIPVTAAADATAAGAGTGAVIGGIGGLLVGLGALAIPGIGPIVAAGPLVSALAGAGIGAVAGGLVGALTNLGVPETEAGYYAEGVRRGGALVTAQVPDEKVDGAMDILDRHHPVDLEERVGHWQQSGWTSFDPNAEPYTAESVNRDRSTYRTDTATYSSSTTEIDSEGWTEVEPPAGESNYAGGRAEASGRSWAEVGDVANFDEDEDVDDEFAVYDPLYRQHYQINYANSGYTYDQYAPAYRYGYDLAVHPSYSSYEWADLEPTARNYWEETNQGTWDQFKEAVRHAWQEVKEALDLDDDDNFDNQADFSRDPVRDRRF
ncbi:MAG TPA: hypothetical protein VEC96_08970 [Anaerolineae bacterium]|nr:hypothetical protein [Anaerolineae bacterium]